MDNFNVFEFMENILNTWVENYYLYSFSQDTESSRSKIKIHNYIVKCTGLTDIKQKRSGLHKDNCGLKCIDITSHTRRQFVWLNI